MTYLLIIVIVFLALAPLWHFMPTKRQRHQASLREAAALAGLFVEFRDLPLSPERLARLPASERQVLYYGARLPASRDTARPRRAWYRESDAWRSVGERAALPAIVEQLPEAVLALGVSEASCGVFWREEGEADTVRQIAELLADWRAVLVGS